MQWVCRLCEREMLESTTEHHLIPRCCHRNKWFRKRFTREQMSETIPLCHDCHRAIHVFIPDEKRLGRQYHSVELLTEHPKLARHLSWVRKQR